VPEPAAAALAPSAAAALAALAARRRRPIANRVAIAPIAGAPASGSGARIDTSSTSNRSHASA